MNHLYIDTASTTGTWLWDKPLMHEEQPHMVRVAAVVMSDETDQPVRPSMCALITPKPGWPMVTPRGTDIHGVYADDLYKIGTDIETVTALLTPILAAADALVGHNADFHSRVLQRAYRDAGAALELPGAEVCTMRGSTDLVRAGTPMPGRWKFPRLAEAYLWATGHGLSLPADPIERGIAQLRAVIEIHRAIGRARR